VSAQLGEDGARRNLTDLVATRGSCTAVENGGRLVSRANLNLHKVRHVVGALGTDGCQRLRERALGAGEVGAMEAICLVCLSDENSNSWHHLLPLSLAR
jgi:hypothetical protein